MAKQEDDGFTDLGYSYDGADMRMGVEDDAPDMHYPKLCITSDKPIDFPEGHFMFTAKGRVAESTEDKDDPENPSYRYEIEVCCVKPGEVVEEAAVSTKDPVDELEKALKGETDDDGE